MYFSSTYSYKGIINLILVSLVFFSCNPTKYVPSGKYLLNQVKVKVDNKRINHDEVKSYIRQKPNKRILGFLGLRLYLGLYNLSDIHKGNGINKYLRKEGEAPVIWDPFATKKDLNQLKIFMHNKGYYQANISDTLIFKKNKVDIVYHIKANEPYVVRSIKYAIEDTLIQAYVYADTVNSLIKRGVLFDRDVLDNERTRLEYFLKNNGFYYFNREAVNYEATPSLMQIDLLMNIKNRIRTVNNQSVPYRQFKIDKVVIKTGLIKTDTLARMPMDSLTQNGILIKYYQRSWVNPGTILQSNYIDPGTLYKVSNVDETKNHLLSLNVFNTPNIQFKRSTRNDTSQFNYLDCQMQLNLLDSIQSFGVEVDGTNSDGNFGGALNLIYQHRSLFRNAESFNLKLRGASEAVKRTDKPQFHYTLEYGVDVTLKIPKFLLPFNSVKFKKKYDPKTTFSMSYNYNQRPDFTQTLANISFGYNWKVGPFVNHILKPISINYVNYDHIDSAGKYFKNVAGTYFENIIKNHIVSALSYSLIFKNQKPNKTTDFRYFRWNFEVAGNLLYLYSRLNHDSTKNGSYRLFNTPYSQYIINELDFHHFHVVNEASRIVYRLYGGLGYSYGNSGSLPYEKSFFSGGANSLRGWQALTLGPGSFVDSISNYPNSTGDIKLEANIEYRFKLPWVLEGAMFADAGNIWSIRPDASRPGASFQWNKFYKDIAISTGIGLRFDFHYFIFRVDLGIKTRNPASNVSNPWIFNQHKLYFTSKRKGEPSDFAICGAINYPF